MYGGGPKTGVAYAALRLTTIKSWGYKKDKKTRSERMEQQIPIDSLRTDENLPEASITASVARKISDAVYYGSGEWDKIPFTVEIFSSVTLKCDQDVETIRTAHNCAYDMAWDASNEHILKATAGHMIDIKTRLCSGSFPEEG